MSPYYRIPLLLIVALSFWATPPVAGQDEERPIWEQEAMLIYSESATEFNRLRSLGSKNPRLAQYARALDVLHGQEDADGEEPYRLAQDLFSELIAENDSDAIGLASLYYLARIQQSNPVEQDISEAKRLYRDLYEAWPDRFFGQMAFVKYATLEIYDDDGTGDGALARLQALEPMLPRITIPELRRNLHRIVGEAYHGFGIEPQRAFEHLERAYRMGLPIESIRVEALVKIAELAEQLGQLERALAAYDELILLAPRHPEADSFEAKARRLRSRLNRAAAQ